MSIDGFCGVLAAFSAARGVPFRHYEYSEPVTAPCIAWYEMDGDSVHSDGVNVHDSVFIHLELYIRPDDEATPAAFEELLTESGLSYERARSWVEERGETLIYYDITI